MNHFDILLAVKENNFPAFVPPLIERNRSFLFETEWTADSKSGRSWIWATAQYFSDIKKVYGRYSIVIKRGGDYFLFPIETQSRDLWRVFLPITDEASPCCFDFWCGFYRSDSDFCPWDVDEDSEWRPLLVSTKSWFRSVNRLFRLWGSSKGTKLIHRWHWPGSKLIMRCFSAE
jgi:hypothetical protein